MAANCAFHCARGTSATGAPGLRGSFAAGPEPTTPLESYLTTAFGRALLAIGADRREFWATQSYEQLAGTYGAQVTRAQLGQLRQQLERAHRWAAEQNRSDRNETIDRQLKDRLERYASFDKDERKWTDEQWTIRARAHRREGAANGLPAEQAGHHANGRRREESIDKPLAKVSMRSGGWSWNDEVIRAAAEIPPPPSLPSR
jgi:hypothetical protein